jgi:thioester reductase-like protein
MPPSGALLKEVMKHQKLRALYLPPSIAEQLLQEPNGIAFFKDLEFLCYTGGPFSEHAGKQLSNVTELCPLYGCTEAFQVPQLAPAAPEDWAWMEWNPHFKVEMQPSSDEDGTFELVLFADSSTSNISALNHNLPGVAEYHTKDLFKQHPKKVGLWQYYGRRDDIVVLSNGEKFNPVPMELLIQGHSALSGVLVVGMGRTQSALIIESKLELNNDEKASLVNEVWPMVERANRLVPAQGRIVPGMLLFSNPEKPFIRAGKGTIVRKLTERLYQAEIDRLYTVEKDSVGPRPPTIRPTLKLVFEAEAISEFVCKIVLEVLPEILELKDGDDLFSSGLDSVKVNQLINLLKTAMNENGKGKDVSWMNTRVIFQHRTVEKLSSVLYDFLNAGKIPIDAVDLSRTTEMQNLLERYTAEIREERSETMPLGDVSTIALIGSTGYLGPHIVASLLRHPGLSTIYCLNRGTDAQVRTNNALQGLEGVWSKEPHKLQFLTIDLGAPHFGLDDATYSTVSMTVDVIIFNSWNPNFSLPIQSFEKPFLQGLKTTIDWGISSVRKPGIVFVSSIAAVGNWTKVHPEQGLIPEEPAKEHNVALHMGYGESKCVAEQMLTRANERSGIPVAILRAGQIGGTTSPHLGTWPIQGWLFNLIKASTELHVFPAHVSPVDWIPVDTFATGILYAVYKIRSHDTLRVYNLVHPNPLPWSFFFNTLRTQFGLEADEVSLSTWLDKLDQVGGSKVDRAKLRSLKMYDFLRSLDQGREEDMQCQSENAAEASAGPPPLTEGLLTTWLSAWNLKSNRWMVKI